MVQAYQEKYGEIYECPVCVENELHMREALADLKGAGCNALAVYLGNFGPETPETLLIKEFDGPARSLRQRRKPGRTWSRAGATPTAACSMQAIT